MLATYIKHIFCIYMLMKMNIDDVYVCICVVPKVRV